MVDTYIWAPVRRVCSVTDTAICVVFSGHCPGCCRELPGPQSQYPIEGKRLCATSAKTQLHGAVCDCAPGQQWPSEHPPRCRRRSLLSCDVDSFNLLASGIQGLFDVVLPNHCLEQFLIGDDISLLQSTEFVSRPPGTGYRSRRFGNLRHHIPDHGVHSYKLFDYA